MKSWEQIAWLVGIVVVAVVVLHFLQRWGIRRLVRIQKKVVDHRLNEFDSLAARSLAAHGALHEERQAQRARTVGQGLSLLIDWALVIIGVLTIMSELGMNLAPLLTTAGIGGIALSFGAQSLVKDLLSGIFMLVEDQFAVGDFINVGDLSGTVQSIGSRVTKIQDPTGEIWYVRNGEVSTLGNQSQGYATSYVTIPVSITEDPFLVMNIFQKIATDMDKDPKWHDQMLEPPQVLGLSEFDSTQMVFTIMTKCPATQQFAVEREVRARAVIAMQENQVKSPTQLIATTTVGQHQGFFKHAKKQKKDKSTEQVLDAAEAYRQSRGAATPTPSAAPVSDVVELTKGSDGSRPEDFTVPDN
jgi:small conductance mechanosensitive channel